MIPANRFPQPDNQFNSPQGTVQMLDPQGNPRQVFPARVRAYPFPGYTETVFLPANPMGHPQPYYKLPCVSASCAKGNADCWSSGPTVPNEERLRVIVKRGEFQNHFWGECLRCGSTLEVYPAIDSPPIPQDECVVPVGPDDDEYHEDDSP